MQPVHRLIWPVAASLLVSACVITSNKQDDDPPSPTTPTTPEPPKPIVVKLLDTQEGREAHALFYDGAGTLVAKEPIGASNQVSYLLPTGGSVLVATKYVNDGFTEYGVQATLNVRPGDELNVGEQQEYPQAQLTVTFAEYAEADSYEVIVGCAERRSASGLSPVTVDVRGCGATAPVLVLASRDGDVLAGAYQASVAVGSPVTITAAYQAVTQRTYALSNYPSEQGNVEITTSRAGLMQTTTTVVTYPPMFTAPVLGSLPGTGHVEGRFNLGGGFSLHVYDNDDFGQASYAANYNDFVVPYASNNMYDASTRTFTWTNNGAGSANLVFINAEVNEESSRHTWKVYAENATANVQVPALPADMGAYALASTSQVEVYLGHHSKSLDLVRPWVHNQILKTVDGARFRYTARDLR